MKKIKPRKSKNLVSVSSLVHSLFLKSEKPFAKGLVLWEVCEKWDSLVGSEISNTSLPVFTTEELCVYGWKMPLKCKI